MKEYNKFIRKLLKNKDFELIKTTTKPTCKLVYIPDGSIYSIHPGDKAVDPLKKWTNNKIKSNENTLKEK